MFPNVFTERIITDCIYKEININNWDEYKNNILNNFNNLYLNPTFINTRIRMESILRINILSNEILFTPDNLDNLNPNNYDIKQLVKEIMVKLLQNDNLTLIKTII